MSIINISSLTFSHEGSTDTLFDHVSLHLDTNWRLGLVGRNGRGKTTFLKLLMGEYEYQGTVQTNTAFCYFPFPISDPSQMTQDIVDTLIPEEDSWKIFKEMNALNLDAALLYQPYNTLSGGEQVKILLAALFCKEDTFLLIDEPTNHLDSESRKLVSDYLQQKSGFILVSHDRSFLDSCIDHVLSINRTDIELIKGNFSVWWENKQRKDEFELAENKRLKKEISHLDAAAKRSTAWSNKTEKEKNVKNSGLRPDRGFVGHKAAKMMKRAKSMESRMLTAAEEKSKLLHNIESTDSLALCPLSHHSRVLASASNLSIAYQTPLFSSLSFEIETNDRISLEGANGTGKSSLLKLFCGEEIPHDGMVHTASGLIISYVSQDTSFLRGNLSDYASEYHVDETLFKTILRKFDFSREQFEKDMLDFSAGQKKKVLLARSLCQKAHLYLWDEPLNFIDVFSRLQIESLILSHKPTLLFTEHDIAFREKIATRHITLSSS